MENQANKPADKKPAMDDKTKKIILIGALAVILILIIVLLIPKSKTTTPTGTPTSNEQTGQVTEPTTTTNTGTSTVVKDKYREEVPTNIVVPDTTTKLSDADKKVIAVPTVVTAAAPGVEAQFRSFDIKGEGGTFTPNKIIARVGDTVHVNFTAVDKDYDIIFPSYNMTQSAKKGQTKVLEFQAVSEGSFLYYCQACGGENGTATGHVVVANK